MERALFDLLTTIDAGEKEWKNLSDEERQQLSGYVNEGKLTEKAYKELEEYRVKRCVIIAAGFGSRMMPVTINTPKPLVRVHGQRIIDSLLDALNGAGIQDVILVRGYHWEQFDQLLYKYPEIRFIENPYYREANNISSVLLAKDFLENAYICEADILLKNPKIIKKYQYCTNYCGVPCDETDDWCLYYDKDHVTGVSVGGKDGYRMYGISYWTKEDGQKLAKYVEEVYNRLEGKSKYWDEVPLDFYLKDFKIEVRTCSFEDFVEIDTFEELKSIDSAYSVFN